MLVVFLHPEPVNMEVSSPGAKNKIKPATANVDVCGCGNNYIETRFILLYNPE